MNWSGLEINSTGKYLRIESNSPQTLRLIGEPTSRVAHGFGKEEGRCTGNGCERCAEGKKGDEPKQRFKANAYSFNNGKVFIWEFGSGIAKQLREIAKGIEADGKTMEDIDIKVSVSGTGMAKKYSVLPSFSAPKPLPPGLALYDLDGSVPF